MDVSYSKLTEVSTPSSPHLTKRVQNLKEPQNYNKNNNHRIYTQLQIVSHLKRAGMHCEKTTPYLFEPGKMLMQINIVLHPASPLLCVYQHCDTLDARQFAYPVRWDGSET